ncbi:MAG: hypothetical protein Q7R54_00575 [bacterium]|nr:hypothetical protein [bacterium]
MATETRVGENMVTFGEFFKKLRGRIERTGRTDAACGDMDRYKDRCRTESVIRFKKEDRGWKVIADQKLSHSNLLEFSAEMAQAGVKRLADRVESDTFDPESFTWTLDSVHEFHHAMLEEARECGLDVDHLSSWLKARDERKQHKSTQKDRLLAR